MTHSVTVCSSKLDNVTFIFGVSWKGERHVWPKLQQNPVCFCPEQANKNQKTKGGEEQADELVISVGERSVFHRGVVLPTKNELILNNTT